MVEPAEAISTSFVSGMYQIHGNRKIENEIRTMSDNGIHDGIDLYKCQERVKEYLNKKYGETWYEKSAEAVQFIIENTYAEAERTKTSQEFYVAHAGVFY